MTLPGTDSLCPRACTHRLDASRDLSCFPILFLLMCVCLRRELDPLQLAFSLNPFDGFHLIQNEDTSPVSQKHRETLCAAHHGPSETPDSTWTFVHCSYCHWLSCLLDSLMMPTQDVPLFLTSRGLSPCHRSSQMTLQPLAEHPISTCSHSLSSPHLCLYFHHDTMLTSLCICAWFTVTSDNSNRA